MIVEHHLAVTRHARYYTIGTAGNELTDVWFACHGYGQLAGAFAKRFAVLSSPQCLVVVPEALSRFYLGDHTRPAGPDAKMGASWMTREDRDAEIRDYVNFLDDLYDEVFQGLPPAGVRITLLGFSQGTSTASRWAALGRARIDRLVLWGGTIAADLDLAAARSRFEGADRVLVIGHRDDYITPKVRKSEEARLRDAGLPFRVVEYEGGHEIDPAALRQLVETEILKRGESK